MLREKDIVSFKPIAAKIMMMMVLMVMMMKVTQHIPTMTDSHHGGFLSVVIMVGICQVTKSHHK